MQISSALVERYGGKEAMEARVAAFAAAIEGHRFTVNVPAPVEDDLIERLARSGEAIEPADPEDEPGEKGPSRLTEIADRLARLETAVIAKTSVTKADVDAAIPAEATLPTEAKA